jgi:hypothetical protein
MAGGAPEAKKKDLENREENSFWFHHGPPHLISEELSRIQAFVV